MLRVLQYEILKYVCRDKTLLTIYGKTRGLEVEEHMVCDKDEAKISKYIENGLKEKDDNIFQTIMKLDYDNYTDMFSGLLEKEMIYKYYLKDLYRQNEKDPFHIYNKFKKIDLGGGHFAIKRDDRFGQRIYYRKLLEEIYGIKLDKRMLMTIHGRYTEKIGQNLGQVWYNIFIQRVVRDETSFSKYIRRMLKKFVEEKDENEIGKFFNIMSTIDREDSWYDRDAKKEIKNLEKADYDWEEEFKNFKRYDCWGELDTYFSKSMILLDDIEFV